MITGTRLVGCLVGLALAVLAWSDANAAAERVPLRSDFRVGTIVVQTSARRLYLITGRGEALRYTVAVGRRGKQWQGRATVASKRIRPAWSPPAEIKRDNPRLPDVIPGGAPNNPMGAAALVLSVGQYAIHGTNNPRSIGRFASYGCIRMHNADIMDLYARVRVGTQVVVLP